MSKKVLAKITMDESNSFALLDSLLCSYSALLNNQFISEEEKKQIKEEKIPKLRKKIDLEYEALFQKYKIPSSARQFASLAYETGEIYVK